jgi:hypothetical protein
MSRLSTMRKLRPVLGAAVTAKSLGADGHSDFDRGYLAALKDVQSLIDSGKPRSGFWFAARRIARSLKALRAERSGK